MITIAAFSWVPEFARGQVRDLRVRWALEEAGLAYDTRLLEQGDQDKPEYRALQPFGQVPLFEQDGLALFESLNSVEPFVMDVVRIDTFHANEEWARLHRPGAAGVQAGAGRAARGLQDRRLSQLRPGLPRWCRQSTSLPRSCRARTRASTNNRSDRRLR